jgi:hypothetical protein
VNAKTPPPPLNFISPPELKTEYANLMRISHSPAEIVLEFARILPGEENPIIVARVVMSPLAVKMLQRVLGENLSRYESTFGEIHFPAPSTLADQLFRPGPEPEPPEDKPEK